MKTNIEIWKDIPGMEGQYQASSLGRIRSLSRYIPVNGPKGMHRRFQKGRVIQLRPRDSTGHLAFDTKHGTTYQTHRLVAATFLGPCPEGLLVLHSNGDPGDNRPENLRYGTQLENQRDVYYQGKRMKTLSLADVEGIRFGFYCGYTDRELARLFGVQPCTINRIRNGKRFGSVTCFFTVLHCLSKPCKYNTMHFHPEGRNRSLPARTNLLRPRKKCAGPYPAAAASGRLYLYTQGLFSA